MDFSCPGSHGDGGRQNGGWEGDIDMMDDIKFDIKSWKSGALTVLVARSITHQYQPQPALAS